QMQALPPVANNANYFNVPREGTNAARTYDVPVLNNASFDCLASLVTINITVAPTYGTILSANFASGGSVVVRYRANGTAPLYVPDQFTYTVTCNGETSAPATAFLLPGNKGDDIKNEICAIPAVPFNWVFGTKAVSTVRANTVDTWLVGDLDLDARKLPEIVVTGGRGALGTQFDSLVVFRDGDVSDATVFNLKGLAGISTGFYRYSLYSARHLISRYSNGKGAYVALNSDGYIYAYEYDTPGNVPTLTWRYKSDQPWKNSTSANQHTPYVYTANNLGVADFDGDGQYEIYNGNKVFSLDGLNYLTGLPDVDLSSGLNWRYNSSNYQNCGWSIQNFGADRLSGVSTTLNNTDDGLITMTVALDLDNDGLPELICGGKAYKVTNTVGVWSMTLYKSAPEVSLGKITDIGAIPIRNDGRVGIADFNKDGYPDVLVSYGSYHASGAANYYWACYGWDVHNDAILFADTVQAQVASYPFIGDIDRDGEVEIGLTKFSGLVIPPHPAPYNVVGQNSYVQAFKLPAVFGITSRLTRKWREDVNENTTRTGMTVFDFNNDGKMEIVYRDMENLRVMNANDDGSITNLIITPSGSGTTNELPVVADIDGDGAAEIICAGGDTYNQSNGRMYVYGSGSTSPWAPSRSVWHQYAYNPTFVNEDLTVPVHAMNPATKFIQENGAATQPYNNFLQQTAISDAFGKTLNPGPNLLFDPVSKPKMNYSPGAGVMTVEARILNNGDVAFTGPVKLDLYYYTAGAYTLLGSTVYGNTASSLAVNSSVAVSFDIAGFMALLPTSFEQF
ncbi:FG-GAP repeat domain-containing protein, partial [Viscerimonas tarda]